MSRTFFREECEGDCENVGWGELVKWRELQMKIAIILGTRPEIVKMSSIIRECQRKKLDFFILHTGQHYSYEMDKAFFDDLELPSPKYNLDVGSGSHAVQTGKIMEGIENILMEEVPDVVLVQGDTNTVLAGALAASKINVKVGHVEAGLRSYDRTMPEEINRVVTDHISDYLLAPTGNSKKYLLAEGIPEEKIFVTGNTVVDAVYQNLEIARNNGDVLKKYGLTEKNYLLATVHRAENTDDSKRLRSIFTGFEQVYQDLGLPILFPAHPRTVKMIKEFGLSVPGGISIVHPLGYLDFLQLEAGAKLILTDSGGLQEEACIMGVPCVTLRDNTERPETLRVGSNLLAGVDSNRIFEYAKMMIDKENTWDNPFGDGKAAEKIIIALE
ncbi:UDP-N-acetylglucosamine 2-epimerase (non-hydrolyzing) [Methanolobus sediminis]|uniref:UDP-N-acetylglucosamine 2-epimerase (Non-hydrolyzing) n=1 Tax=Methanolobus sediminis TaxID=3072978 RepID=A0AA51UJ80_9EURY|nr:UDP-N-acetylglucosamine 2-epimerase (non-hydrolyzing) [Methanolobus sediminis]WMW24379.1 UDP-N-acetylglucosamine 2-epimerase (non-hydrolyzing) [Methanolobus sediminis]